MKKIFYLSLFLLIIVVFLFSGNSFVYADSTPTVYTNHSIASGPTSALLNGSIIPNGLPTTAWFEYGTTPSLGNTSASQSAGGGVSYRNYSTRVNNLQPDTHYYFRAVAQNSQGTSHGIFFEFTTERGIPVLPNVSTSAASAVSQTSAVFNGSVNPHGSHTNGWFEWGVSAALGFSTQASFQNIGTGDTDVGYAVNMTGLLPQTTYYYRAAVQNSAGVVRGSIVNFSTGSVGNGGGGGGGNSGGGGGGIVQTLTKPNITTLPASFIARNSALLNANVNPNGSPTSVWFAWGTSASLGNTTSQKSVGNSFNVLPSAAVLSGLFPNTIYYFQAVAQNQYGTQFGAVLSFRTTSVAGSGGGPAPRTITERTPPLSGPAGTIAKITLSPSADNYEPNAGDEVEFTVLYRNESAAVAKDAKLRIISPKEVEYVDANLPVASQNDNGVEFVIGDIGENNQGAVTIKVKVKNSVSAGDVLLFQAVMDYKEMAGEIKSVSVFLALVVSAGGNVLGAFIGGFAGWGFWLLILFILIAILFLIFLLFVRRRQKEEDQREAVARAVPGGRL